MRAALWEWGNDPKLSLLGSFNKGHLVCAIQLEERVFPLNSTKRNLMQDSRKIETYKKATVHIDWVFPPTPLHLNLLQAHPTSTRVPYPGNTSLPSSMQEQGRTRCNLPTRSNFKSLPLQHRRFTLSQKSHTPTGYHIHFFNLCLKSPLEKSFRI